MSQPNTIASITYQFLPFPSVAQAAASYSLGAPLLYDTDPATGYTAPAGQVLGVLIDLGTAQQVAGMGLSWIDYPESESYTPDNATVYVSTDGTNWTDWNASATQSGDGGTGAVETATGFFGVVTARFIQIIDPPYPPTSGGEVTLSEVSVYAPNTAGTGLGTIFSAPGAGGGTGSSTSGSGTMPQVPVWEAMNIVPQGETNSFLATGTHAAQVGDLEIYDPSGTRLATITLTPDQKYGQPNAGGNGAWFGSDSGWNVGYEIFQDWLTFTVSAPLSATVGTGYEVRGNPDLALYAGFGEPYSAYFQVVAFYQSPVWQLLTM